MVRCGETQIVSPIRCLLLFTSLRSQRLFVAPHLADAKHSATAKTLHTRGDAGCTKAARSVITQQSGGCDYHGQACTQCYNAAVGRVCFPWSGVRAVL